MLSSLKNQMFRQGLSSLRTPRFFSRQIVFPEHKPAKITVYNSNVGILQDILGLFNKYNINMISIESKIRNKRSEGIEAVDFYVTYDDPVEQYHFNDLIFELNKREINMYPLPIPRCPGFPIHISDLDNMQLVKLESEVVNPDDPLYSDKEYAVRRKYLESLNTGYKMGSPIKRLEYTEQETATWTYIWDKLMPQIKEHGCAPFVKYLENFVEMGIFKRNEIPQLDDLNRYLIKKNNWRIKPVNGIISQRQYLNILAFRTFPSTQYIRHHSTPEYTPEPDICHEFFGHMAAFADPAICDLSQKIGLLSLGATDSQLKILGAIYWYTIEFGVVMENGKRKFYGGGIASSFKEIENMNNCTDMRKLDLVNDNVVPDSVVVQDVQPHFYYANNFREVVDQLDEFGRMMGKPFKTHYSFLNNQIVSDTALEFMEDKDAASRYE